MDPEELANEISERVVDATGGTAGPKENYIAALEAVISCLEADLSAARDT